MGKNVQIWNFFYVGAVKYLFANILISLIYIPGFRIGTIIEK
jgi:hypothetical protein